jgi:hypothetical protein
MSGSGSEQGGRVSRRGKDIIRNLLIGMLAVLALVATAFALTPWPSVLIVRALFDRGAAKASRKLEAYVPASVMTDTVRYDQADADALLDIHRPRGIVAGGPTVVWILGGGFVSGRRGDVTNYAKILAGQGFVVVNVDYTIAPEAEYPGPVRQVSKALGFLSRNNKRLGLASGRLSLRAIAPVPKSRRRQRRWSRTRPMPGRSVFTPKSGRTSSPGSSFTAGSMTSPAWARAAALWVGLSTPQAGRTAANVTGV